MSDCDAAQQPLGEWSLLLGCPGVGYFGAVNEASGVNQCMLSGLVVDDALTCVPVRSLSTWGGVRLLKGWGMVDWAGKCSVDLIPLPLAGWSSGLRVCMYLFFLSFVLCDC